MKRVLFLLIMILLSLSSVVLASNKKVVAIYDLNGNFVGSSEKISGLKKTQARAFSGRTTVQRDGKLIQIPAGIYFIAPQETPNPQSNSSALEFIDVTESSLPQQGLHGGDVKVADIDGDSREDIILSIYDLNCDTTADTRPRVYIQNIDGTFSDQTDSLMCQVRAGSYSLQLLDVENDSDMDIFINGYYCDSTFNSAATLLLNDGTGHFVRDTVSWLSSIPINRYVYQSAVGDLNNDSKTDIVVNVFPAVAERDEVENFPDIQIWYNNGDGSFYKDSINDFVGEKSYGYYRMFVTDLNKDSLNDITFANMQYYLTGPGGPEILDTLFGGISVFMNQGDGRFIDQTSSRFPSPVNTSIRDLAIGDLDNDGDLDVVEGGFFFQSGPRQVVAYSNNGTGGFAIVDSAISSGIRGWFNKICIKDFNKDDLGDVFLTKVMSGTKDYDVLLLNSGPVNFGDASELLPQRLDFSTSAEVFDFQHDGDWDIVTANSGGNADSTGQMALYRNMLMEYLDVKDDKDLTPEMYSLSGNYPNPFNPSTKIQYSLLIPGYVSIDIYNLLGQKIESLINSRQATGSYEIVWNAVNLPDGVYYYRLLINGEVKSAQKAVLLK